VPCYAIAVGQIKHGRPTLVLERSSACIGYWLKDSASCSSVDDVDSSGCGASKACFRVPDDCTTNCDYIVTWANAADQVVSFEMSATASSDNYWVSVGLSHDQTMVQIWQTLFTLAKYYSRTITDGLYCRK